jgi:hypothetical protein
VGYSGCMGRSLTRNAVLKELDVVGDKLAARALTREKRLTLLRRQAELGDLRDALAERARRNLAL